MDALDEIDKTLESGLEISFRKTDGMITLKVQRRNAYSSIISSVERHASDTMLRSSGYGYSRALGFIIADARKLLLKTEDQ